MPAGKYLKYLQKEIHTTTAAADGNGLPVTCAIDIMDGDETDFTFNCKEQRFFCLHCVNCMNVCPRKAAVRENEK